MYTTSLFSHFLHSMTKKREKLILLNFKVFCLKNDFKEWKKWAWSSKQFFFKTVWLILKRTYTAFDSLLLEWDINDPGEVEQVWMSEKK